MQSPESRHNGVQIHAKRRIAPVERPSKSGAGSVQQQRRATRGSRLEKRPSRGRRSTAVQWVRLGPRVPAHRIVLYAQTERNLVTLLRETSRSWQPAHPVQICSAGPNIPAFYRATWTGKAVQTVADLCRGILHRTGKATGRGQPPKGRMNWESRAKVTNQFGVF